MVPLHASEAAGGSKLQTLPHSTVLLVAQTSTGGVVSTLVTLWLQVLVLPQASRAIQVAVSTSGHVPLVTTPTSVTATLVPLHASDASGGLKLQTLPHSTVLLVAQVMLGGVVSSTVTVWLHVAVLVQSSVAIHVRVASNVLPE